MSYIHVYIYINNQARDNSEYQYPLKQVLKMLFIIKIN